MSNLEIKIVQYCNNIGGKKIDNFLSLINSIRFLAFFWIAIVIAAIFKHPEIMNNFIIAVFLVAILHFIITEGIIKHLSLYFVPKRKRPFIAYPDIVKSVGKKFSDSSFPSSHMASSVAMLFIITSFYPSLIIPSVLFVLLMAFSRLHNGMHYPSDIIVGIILGWLYGYIAIYMLHYLF